MSKAGPKVLLVVGGGIAAYKSCELVRLIRKGGGDVTCVVTKGGQQFVTPMSLAALSENQVYTSLFDLKNEVEMGHIELSREADLIDPLSPFNEPPTAVSDDFLERATGQPVGSSNDGTNRSPNAPGTPGSGGAPSALPVAPPVSPTASPPDTQRTGERDEPDIMSPDFLGPEPPANDPPLARAPALVPALAPAPALTLVPTARG